MNSPLFNAFNASNALSGSNALLQRFQQFQRTFQGDPKQQVQQLLNSGRVSQAQYNAAVQQAQQIMQMMKGINPSAQG